jgi:hypothetical protein
VAWLIVFLLVRAFWIPRGCERIRVTADDLVSVSPAARAQAVGKPRLRRSLWITLTLAGVSLCFIPRTPLIGAVGVVLFGLLSWNAWRSLRTLG